MVLKMAAHFIVYYMHANILPGLLCNISTNFKIINIYFAGSELARLKKCYINKHYLVHIIYFCINHESWCRCQQSFQQTKSLMVLKIPINK